MVLGLNKIFQACPEDWARNELSAHINKIKFYCHQLNMCAKVKAEVQNIAGELVVSGLDSATSLIQVKYCNEITSKHNFILKFIRKFSIRVILPILRGLLEFW